MPEGLRARVRAGARAGRARRARCRCLWTGRRQPQGRPARTFWPSLLSGGGRAQGRPVRLSDAAQNVLGLVYIGWLGVLGRDAPARGCCRSVAHLLLFTALAKLASLKRPSEARLALLVVFLLTLAVGVVVDARLLAALYFAAMAWLGFRTLAPRGRAGRLRRGAAGAGAHERCRRAGLSAVAIVGGRAVRPRRSSSRCRACTGPSSSRPSAWRTRFAKALAADRVDLESFGAAKRSDRVVLRLSSRPRASPATRRCACARRSSPTTATALDSAIPAQRRAPGRAGRAYGAGAGRAPERGRAGS